MVTSRFCVCALCASSSGEFEWIKEWKLYVFWWKQHVRCSGIMRSLCVVHKRISAIEYMSKVLYMSLHVYFHRLSMESVQRGGLFRCLVRIVALYGYSLCRITIESSAFGLTLSFLSQPKAQIQVLSQIFVPRALNLPLISTKPTTRSTDSTTTSVWFCTLCIAHSIACCMFRSTAFIHTSYPFVGRISSCKTK